MDLCIKPFSDLNPDDSFFDSLKASYPEFKEWFQKKAEAREQAYVFFDETEKLWRTRQTLWTDPLENPI